MLQNGCWNCNNLIGFNHIFIVQNSKVTYWKCDKFTDDNKTIRKMLFRDYPSSRCCDNWEQIVKKKKEKNVDEI